MKLFNRFLIISLIISANALNTYAQGLEALNPERGQVHQKPIAELSPMEIMEDSLVYMADSMYKSSIPEDRIDASYAFIKQVRTLMTTKGTYGYPFPKLKEKINILSAPDNAFKIYNWEINRGSNDIRYYGVIQLKDGSFIPLIDASDQIIRGAEDSIFVGTRWFGCLYYNIIQRDVDGQKVYFLLGWNGSGMNSERKIVEPFGFSGTGQSQFGAPVFNTIERGKRKRPMRFITEYQKSAKIFLNYDKETDQIIMDHCESQIGDPAKRFTYIPDGSYDALKWDGKQWVMFEDVVKMQDLQQGNAPIEKPLKK